MKNYTRLSLLIVLFCLVLAVTACTSKENSSDQIKQTGQANTTYQIGNPKDSNSQPDNKVYQQEIGKVTSKQDLNAKKPVDTFIAVSKNVNKNSQSAVIQEEGATQTGESLSPNQSNKNQLANNGNTQIAVDTEQDNAIKKEMPCKAYVITYNAECCEKTKRFFEQHRNKVKELENKYGNLVKFEWYDYAVKDNATRGKIMDLMKTYKVVLPALIIVDSEDNVLAKQTDEQSMDEVIVVLEGLKD